MLLPLSSNFYWCVAILANCGSGLCCPKQDVAQAVCFVHKFCKDQTARGSVTGQMFCVLLLALLSASLKAMLGCLCSDAFQLLTQLAVQDSGDTLSKSYHVTISVTVVVSVSCTVTFLCNNCFCSEKGFPYIELSLLRSTTAVKTQELVPNCCVLIKRLSLHRMSLHREVTVSVSVASSVSIWSVLVSPSGLCLFGADSAQRTENMCTTLLSMVSWTL